VRSLKCCVSPHEERRWVQLRRYVAQLRGPRAARRGCLVSRLQLSARLYRQHVPGEQVRSAVAQLGCTGSTCQVSTAPSRRRRTASGALCTASGARDRNGATRATLNRRKRDGWRDPEACSARGP
jgi:hypothetical protein